MSHWERDFLRNLRQTVSAGITLSESFALLTEYEVNEEKKERLSVASRALRQGATLSASLQKARCLTPFEIGMVKAGEESGGLLKVLHYLSDNRERSGKVEHQIKASLLYPCVSLVFCLVTAMFVLPYLMRGQLEVLQSTGTELPRLTRFLLLLSDSFVSIWFWLSALALVGFGFWLKTQFEKSGALRRRAAELLLLTPFGSLYKSIGAVRFARPFCLAFSAGLPLEKNLKLAFETSNNALLMDVGRSVTPAIMAGASLSEALAQTEFFSPTFLAMLTVGEESGKLDALALKATELLEFELAENLQRVATAIQPFAMLLMGSIVGIFALGILLPTVKVLESL